MKRVSARAIIIENNKLLVMFRRTIKDGIVKEYYALLGGGVEGNETLEETVKREMMEEAKEEEAIYNKYYQMLTVKEKFDLAESDFLDDDYDPNWYLGPKLFVEARQKEGKGNE